MLLQDLSGKIARYNQLCLHYDLVANAVYGAWRESQAPFSGEYRPYLIAALLVFDMGRMMGKGPERRYDVAAGGFAARLERKLLQVRRLLEPVIGCSLFEIDLPAHRSRIGQAYNALAADGTDGLHEQGKAFHVGATKILHFLNPEVFIIVDANAAKLLKAEFHIPYRSAMQPGYSAIRYVRALVEVQEWIQGYGVERFRALEPGTPALRIFDKMAFVCGAGL